MRVWRLFYFFGGKSPREHMSSASISITRKLFSDLTAFEVQRWEQLHACDERGTWAFMSPGFAEAINSCVTPVFVLMLWRGSDVVGYLPIQRSNSILGFWGLYEPAGTPMCDYFGLVAESGVKINWQRLLRKSGVPCLVFSHLDQHQIEIGLVGEQPRIGYRTRLTTGGSACWDWFKVNYKELARDVERRFRKLEREHGPIEFEMDSSRPEEVMRMLVEWKSRQYVRTGKMEGVLLSDEYINVLEYILKNKNASAFPILSTLRCDGKLIAVHFGMRVAGVLHRWFPAYDPLFSAYSPGKILYKEMLVGAHQHGINCIDRGDGDSAAKRDFSTEEHFYYKGLVYVGIRGTLIALLQRIFWRLKIQ